jgi:hypothetical protein
VGSILSVRETPINSPARAVVLPTATVKLARRDCYHDAGALALLLTLAREDFAPDVRVTLARRWAVESLLFLAAPVLFFLFAVLFFVVLFFTALFFVVLFFAALFLVAPFLLDAFFLLLDALLLALFFAGTFPPARRASDKPMAIACLRLLTVLPLFPLFSVPALRSCIAFVTFCFALLPYLAISVLLEA